MMFDTLNRVAAHYRDLIEGDTFRLKHSCNFSELETVTIEEGNQVSPHFSTQQNTFFRDEALWVGVFVDGRCIATVALKHQPLGSETLAEWSRRYWLQTYREGSDTAIVFGDQQKRFLLELSGDLVYCGEYRVAKDYQQSGIGKWLAHYIKAVAFLKWPKTLGFYIFMEDKDVRRGLLAAIELTRQIPNALSWDQPPSQAKPDYWLASISNSDFSDWLDDQARLIGADQDVSRLKE